MKPGDTVIVKLWSGEEIVGKLVREEYLTSGERVSCRVRRTRDYDAEVAMPTY